MSKFVIGHGINNIAAYSFKERAEVEAKSTEPVEINGNMIECSVLEIPEGDYFIDTGMLHHIKWNIVVPLIE